MSRATVLMLDDDRSRLAAVRSRLPSVTTCETAAGCIALLAGGGWTDVLLDHDLGGEVYVDPDLPNTGSAVARWLAANPDRFRDTRFVIHSFNPAGAANMTGLLAAAGLSVVRAPFNGDDFWAVVDGLYQQGRGDGGPAGEG